MASTNVARTSRDVTPRADPQPKAGSRPAAKPSSGRSAFLNRRARLLFVVASLVVAGALLVVVAGQAMVASQQIQIDGLHNSLSSAVSTNENLQLTRAQLEAPGRVLVLAEQELHMVVPKSVTYLNPVNPGPTIVSVRSASGR